MIEHGYDSLESKNPITGRLYITFIHGVKGLERRDLFLYCRDNGKGAPRDPDTTLVKEAKAILSNEHPDISDIIAGTASFPLIRLTHNYHVYQRVLKACAEKVTLSKEDVIEVFEFPRPERRVSKRILQQDPAFDSASMSCGYVFPPLDGVSAALEIDVATEVLSIFEECQVLQARSERDMKYIQWHIRSDCEYYEPDAMKAAERTGLYWKGLPKSMKSEKRPQPNLRQHFDDWRIQSARDEFRLQFAMHIGLVDPDEIPWLAVIDDCEAHSFERQYQALSQKKQREFDQEAEKFLKRLERDSKKR